MPRESFPSGVADLLHWYVYRLIDPRNGETFYVGKGRGNRIFEHVQGLPAADQENFADPKLQRIKEIVAAGLEVAHVIHRHGIHAQGTAYEVEAALIDAYPGLANKARGRGSTDYGSRHVEEIIDEYAGEEFEVKEPLILISIGRMYYQRANVYDAVRCAWKIDPKKAEKYNLVLANLRGLVVGVFRPTQWVRGTLENFPGLETVDLADRWGFIGEPAEAVVWDTYVRKRVPKQYRRRGAADPIRYCDPG